MSSSSTTVGRGTICSPACPYMRHCVVCKEDLPMEDAEEFRLHLLGHVAEALFNIDDRLGRIERRLDGEPRPRERRG